MSIYPAGDDLSAALQLLDTIEAALQEVEHIPDGVNLLRRAAALEQLMRLAAVQADIQRRATAARLRTARRLGQLLLAMPKHPGGRPPENLLHDETGFQTIEGLGISRRDAACWQRLALLPDARFDEFLDTAIATGRDLSVAGAMRFAAAWIAKYHNHDGAGGAAPSGGYHMQMCPTCLGLGWIPEAMTDDNNTG